MVFYFVQRRRKFLLMNLIEVFNKRTQDLIALMTTNFKLKADKTELAAHTGNKENPHGTKLTHFGVNASATELNHVKGVTSGIQEQLDGKSDDGHKHALADVTDVTASATEVNYTKGVKSAIQTQLDGKSDDDHTHPVDSSLSSTSTNPVQNKVVKTELDKKATTSALDSHTSDTVKHITSTERTTWNNKSDFSGNYNDLEDAPNIVEDGTGTLKIMDQNDNIIMEIGKDGLNVAKLTVNGTGDVATVLTQYEEAIDTNKTNIDKKADKTDLTSHTGNKNNPHGVTLSQLGVTATAAELNKLDGVTATTAELNYVDGVTSNIQTQLNAKQATITGAATTITGSDLTKSRALVSNSNGKVAVSAVTSTELGYLDGVTSNVQAQLDSKEPEITVLPVTKGGTGNSSVDTTPTSGSTKMVTSGGVYTAIDTVNTELDTKMDKANPTGTGAFSLNRKAGSGVGSYSSTLGSENTASGIYSHAEGHNNTAQGEASHTEGFNTVANEKYAHAEGKNAIAQGQSSHAEGTSSIAFAESAHAEGYSSYAIGKYSHAEGHCAWTYGDASHAEGQYTTAYGEKSHAEGYEIIAVGIGSHAEGEGCRMIAKITGDANATTYTVVVGEDDYIFEDYLIKCNDKVALVTDFDTDDYYEYHIATDKTLSSVALSSVDIEIYTSHSYGEYSHSEGGVAIGKYSHAEYGGYAYGDYSHAEGTNSEAHGISSHAEGSSYAYGTGSHAEGQGRAYGIHSHAECSAYAHGSQSHAEGRGNSYGTNSHAEGYDTISSGHASHAQGKNTKAYGEASNAEGYQTMAFGDYSHAEGEGESSNITITGDANATVYTTNAASMLVIKYYGLGAVVQYNDVYAIITNIDVDNYQITTDVTLSSSAISSQAATMHVGVASGKASHSEGYWCNAGGYCSHAEGSETKAIGSYSHAAGIGTIALAGQLAIGHFNDTTTATGSAQSGTSSDSAFVIGNGNANNGSNAFRVTYTGTPYAKNALTTTGCDYAEFFEWFDGNPNSEDRRGYFVTLDGEKITKAKQGDYILGITSALPSIIGNGDECWKGRYILDEFGGFIEEEFEYEVVVDRKVIINEETGERTVEEIKEKKIGTKYKENPDYDPTAPYVQRSERPEWSTVGMLGVIAVRDDGSCKVNGFCTVSNDGTAIASDNGYRVVARVTDNIVKVIFR